MRSMVSTTGFVPVNGVRLHVHHHHGAGPALVLLHGLTDSGACWGHVAAHLTPEFDIAAVDLRGHGLSDIPLTGYAVKDHAEDVIGILEATGSDAATLVGHSLGADVAMQVALLRPDLVTQLVIEDPPWSHDWEQSGHSERRRLLEDWTRNLQHLKSLSFEQLLASGRLQNPNWVEQELRPWAQSKLEASVQALDYVSTSRPAWQLVLSGLRCPTLLVTGETSLGSLVSEAMADEARSLSSELEVLHLRGAGHCVHRDQFGAYLEGLRRFLAPA
jgi:N-formylmaleamate deformylase